MLECPDVADRHSIEVPIKRARGSALVRSRADAVVAGVDCGFGTFVGWEWVTEDVVWAKLKTLRAGADLASARLWGKPR